MFCKGGFQLHKTQIVQCSKAMQEFCAEQMALSLQQIKELDLIRPDEKWPAYWFRILKLHSYSGRTSKDYIRKL